MNFFCRGSSGLDGIACGEHTPANFNTKRPERQSLLPHARPLSPFGAWQLQPQAGVPLSSRPVTTKMGNILLPKKSPAACAQPGTGACGDRRFKKPPHERFVPPQVRRTVTRYAVWTSFAELKPPSAQNAFTSAPAPSLISRSLTNPAKLVCTVTVPS